MSRPPRLEITEGIYHVTSQGNGRSVIFHTDEDRVRFLEQLKLTLQKYRIVLYAYVLMDNHYHLLIRTPEANLSAFVQRLNTSYALYHHYKQKRPGHCFQGRFGAKLVQSKRYLKSLSRYIHLNPVKVKQWNKKPIGEKCEYLKNYKWSSYRGYVDEIAREDFVCYDMLKGQSGNQKESRKAYKAYVLSCLGQEDKETRDLLEKSSYAVGDDTFVEGIEGQLRQRRLENSTGVDLELPSWKYLSIKELKNRVFKTMGLAADKRDCEKADFTKARAIIIELASKYSGTSQRMIGQYFNLSPAGIAKVRKKFIEENLDSRVLSKKLFAEVEKDFKKLNNIDH